MQNAARKRLIHNRVRYIFNHRKTDGEQAKPDTGHPRAEIDNSRIGTPVLNLQTSHLLFGTSHACG